MWEGQALNAELFRADFTAGWSQASVPRPSRQLQGPAGIAHSPLYPHTHLLHPYSAQRGPAWISTAQPNTAAPDRPHSLLTMATVWGMHEERRKEVGWSGVVILMERVSGKHSSPFSPPANSARGSRFLWDYFSFFSLFALPICFISIIFSSFSHLLSKALSRSAYPRTSSAPMRARPVYNTGTPWPLHTGSFWEAELGQSSWRTDWHRARLVFTVPDQWQTGQTNDRMMKMGINSCNQW